MLQFTNGGAKVFGVDLTQGAIQRPKELFDIYGYSVESNTINVESLDIFLELILGDNLIIKGEKQL